MRNGQKWEFIFYFVLKGEEMQRPKRVNLLLKAVDFSEWCLSPVYPWIKKNLNKKRKPQRNKKYIIYQSLSLSQWGHVIFTSNFISYVTTMFWFFFQIFFEESIEWKIQKYLVKLSINFCPQCTYLEWMQVQRGHAICISWKSFLHNRASVSKWMYK